MCSSAMLSTTGTSPRCGSATVPRKAEIANKIAVPIIDRSPVVHSGGRYCRIALMTGLRVPHATAMAARRAIASRRRNRSGFIRPGPKSAIWKEYPAGRTAQARSSMTGHDDEIHAVAIDERGTLSLHLQIEALDQRRPLSLLGVDLGGLF